MSSVKNIKIPLEIQRICEGCNGRGICRLNKLRIPTIHPVEQHLCTDCERGLNSMGIPTLRVMHIGSNNMKVRL